MPPSWVVRLTVRHVQSLYKQHGFRVDAILSDTEGAVKGMQLALGDIGIKINLASKGEHVPEIERAIRQIKERVRGFVNTFRYRLPNVMLVYLVFYCVCSGLSESPKELFTGVKADFNRDFRLQFGSYVKVHEDNAVTNELNDRQTYCASRFPIRPITLA